MKGFRNINSIHKVFGGDIMRRMTKEQREAIEKSREARRQNKQDTAMELSYRSKKWLIRQSDSDNWELIESSIVDGKETAQTPLCYPSKLYCLQITLDKMVDCTVSQGIEKLLKEIAEIRQEIKDALR